MSEPILRRVLSDIRDTVTKLSGSESQLFHDAISRVHVLDVLDVEIAAIDRTLAASQPPSGDAPDLREALRAFGERLAADGYGWEAIITRETPSGEQTVAHLTTANPDPAALATPAPLDVESPASGVSIVGPPSDGRWLVQWLVRLIDDGRVTDLNPDDEYVVAARAYANQEGGEPREEAK